MEKVSLEAGNRCSAVHGVANDRMAKGREMDPYLVGTAGMKPNVEQAVAIRILGDPVRGSGRTGCQSVNAHTFAILGISTNRRLDGRLGRFDPTGCQRPIAPLSRAFGNLKL